MTPRERALLRDRIARARLEREAAAPKMEKATGAMKLEASEDRLLAAIEEKRRQLEAEAVA